MGAVRFGLEVDARKDLVGLGGKNKKGVKRGFCAKFTGFFSRVQIRPARQLGGVATGETGFKNYPVRVRGQSRCLPPDPSQFFSVSSDTQNGHRPLRQRSRSDSLPEIGGIFGLDWCALKYLVVENWRGVLEVALAGIVYLGFPFLESFIGS